MLHLHFLWGGGGWHNGTMAQYFFILQNSETKKILKEPRAKARIPEARKYCAIVPACQEEGPPPAPPAFGKGGERNVGSN